MDYLRRYIKFVTPIQNKERQRQSTTETDEVDGFLSVPFGDTDSISFPWAIVIVSIIQIAIFLTQKFFETMIEEILIYNPTYRIEIWRFLSYMLIHMGYGHIILNIVIQIFLVIPLETTYPWWKIQIIYLLGVITGCLMHSLKNPYYSLCGASSGVYSFLAANLASIILNWKQMKENEKHPLYQLIFFLIYIIGDISYVLVQTYYYKVNDDISYFSHLGGSISGLMVGLMILQQKEKTKTARCCFIIYGIFVLALILAEIFWTNHFPETHFYWQSSMKNRNVT